MAEDKKAENGAKKPAKADKKKKPRKNPFKSIASFFKSVNAERKKVVWPTGKETIKNAAIVLVVTVIVGVAIFAVDSFLSWGMKQIRNAAPERTTISDSVDEDTEGDAENAEDTDGEAEDTEDTESDAEEGTEAEDGETETEEGTQDDSDSDTEE